MNKIKFFDTTLRDGEQAPGCSMNINEKIEIAKQLEMLGIDIIEAGFAVVSPDDFRAVKEISETVKSASVASLARAIRSDIDEAYKAVKNAVSPRIHVFLATSPIHMERKLKMTPSDVLENIRDSVSYAASLCGDVEFSAEDATRSNPDFLAKAVETAVNAGAKTINLPDTVGYAAPSDMISMINNIKSSVDLKDAIISVHCHNDLGLAAANSLAAIDAGAVQIEGTINGIGERAGNAALEEIIMALKTRKNIFNAEMNIDTRQIHRTSKLVYHVIGSVPPANKAIVGTNAFAHEAGIHQHGVMEDKKTYEIMNPEDIGLRTNKMVLGKHSGKHAFSEKLKETGYSFDEAELESAFSEFKKLCDRKKNIIDADIEAIMNKRVKINVTYVLDGFDVHTGSTGSTACVVRLKKGEKIIEDVSLGNGPVEAAINVINKIAGLKGYLLDDYNIHSISEGRDALGEVIVKIKKPDGKRITGRGLSTNIIESSILAYVDGINKILDA